MSNLNNDIKNIQPTKTLEAEKLNCPLPLLKIKKSLAQLSRGDVLQVTGIHNVFLIDIRNWCERNDHFFLNETKNNLCDFIYIKKG